MFRIIALAKNIGDRIQLKIPAVRCRSVHRLPGPVDIIHCGRGDTFYTIWCFNFTCGKFNNKHRVGDGWSLILGQSLGLVFGFGLTTSLCRWTRVVFFDSATRNSRPMSEYLESLKSDSREHRDLGEKTSWRHGDLLGIQSTQGLELDPGMA
jgi:hypothetical protein